MRYKQLEEEINVYIAGINCTFEDAVREASKGKRVIILYEPAETYNGKPAIELVNFSQEDATEFYSMIDTMIGGGASLIKQYI